MSVVLLLFSAGLYLAAVYRHHRQVWDDAYITFRFAKHLFDGSGLIWNIGGERVEGYSSLLHVVLIGAAMKVGLSPESGALILGVGATLGTVILLVSALRRQFRLLHPAAALLIGTYLIDNATAVHSTTGLETQLFVLLLTVCLVTAETFVGAPRWPAACGMGVSVFLSALCRPEGVLYGGASYAVLTGHTGWQWIRKEPGSTTALRRLALSAALTCSLGVIYVTWKYRYFGYLLPNSFYVKSNRISLMGLGEVVRFLRHVALMLGPFVVGFAFFIRRRDLTAGLHDSRVLARALLVMCPPVAALAYYATIVHEAGEVYRFSYPTLVYLVLASCVLVIIATRAKDTGGHPQSVLLVTVLGIAILAAGQTSWTVRPLPPDGFSQWTSRIALALKDTGLGSRATVLSDAAGVIPFFSGLNHVDRVGLMDNYLAGRKPVSPEARERYIWSRDPDVYVGYEPPASENAEGPEDDPKMDTPYVRNVLTGIKGRIAERVFVREPRLLHQRMRELRDNWCLVGEVKWPGWQLWKLKSLLYVRKASPHAARLSSSLRRIIALTPDRIDLDHL
jgi:hypothetical protein